MARRITEYLEVDLATERWMCQRCGHDLGDARDTYKKGCLIADRDPREVHPPIVEGASTASRRTPTGAGSSSSTARPAPRCLRSSISHPAIP